MARPTTAARRYAEAVFQLAASDDSYDRWATDLALAAEIVADPEVARIVNSPAVPLKDRARLLGSMLGKRLAPRAINLVKLLDQRGRIALLPAIAVEYGRQLDQMRGVVVATVTSAAPLEPEETAAVEAKVEQMTGSTVRLASVVDPALIGGLTVRVGDRLIDASVRGRLERLRAQLVAGTR
jgi:F-type H+-transporting ATPase subunit delta